jgi:hypothetical protein
MTPTETASHELVEASRSTRTEHEVRTDRERLAVAVSWRKIIWRSSDPEDNKIDRLIDVCTKLEDGDAEAGKRLASRAIWLPS